MLDKKPPYKGFSANAARASSSERQFRPHLDQAFRRA
jgi:hypothetical protein